jgi:hypothetical protein
MKKAAIAAGLVLVVSCATPVNFELTDANLREGLLTFTYEHTPYQVPIPNDVTARVQALHQCKQWGYLAAEKFPYTSTVCKQHKFDVCLRWQVQHRYKCRPDQIEK